MNQPIVTMQFDEWISDMIKEMAPYAKTIRATDKYFAAGNDDVNVEFSRKMCGYGNWHFTVDDLCEFYGAESCIFDADFAIWLEFKSWDDLRKDSNGEYGSAQKGKICGLVVHRVFPG